MEDLLAQFEESTQISDAAWMRGCNFKVRYDVPQGGVFALEHVGAGSVIGEIFGEPTYVWDIHHCEYLFIDDDMVVDVSRVSPKQVLAFLRDDNQSNHPCNCEILVQYNDEHMRFFLIATRAIYVGEELVYAVYSRI